ncbi:MAG TPA: hypothetical protein VL860_13015 [Planctomycetota bacterium]|jgi:CHASE2 domain-containing sensor protein|nr:hypothetical protein [Planctomycetota bacterium]
MNTQGGFRTMRRGAFLMDMAVGLGYLLAIAGSVGGCVALFLSMEFDPVITILLSFPLGLILGLTLIYGAVTLFSSDRSTPAADENAPPK